ncbi:patatin-like phospholipase family protein [Ramlibacter sp. WS9]|uniref:patatin-like phospholipase family protein n=1 Tax=Ramlibacter sp. WS9 TaxID=1882741 RepID=UPI001144BC08|nr:patatin-like phospholipase family protein [Ramlibacter sp. WS9]ROZ74966.1 patatin-like phospholipase family protein [Ramlibacter sp. WS9]
MTAASKRKPLPGQVVLVLQGGGALGAYQAGVYQAMHESGIEPDWVIGTSIGAINAALIAGNPPGQRLDRLRKFWKFSDGPAPAVGPLAWLGMDSSLAMMNTVMRGIPNFFEPNPAALFGTHADVGVEAASYYSMAPLRESLTSLIGSGQLGQCSTRLTVGAVNARSGEMRYFDSRHETLSTDHVLASGALPPAFPAVRIEGEPYWDGGIYSNTPIEAVFDDHPRRDSLIFAVDVWQPDGPEPQSIWQVMGRQKDIQYASRTQSHLARQEQIQRLRRVIREMEKHVPAGQRSDPEVRELATYGCGATMHVLRLLAPRLEGESQAKDIDFTVAGVRTRWQAGYKDTLAMIERAPWEAPVDLIAGVVEHLGAKR